MSGINWRGNEYKAALRREVARRNAVSTKAVAARAALIHRVEGAGVAAKSGRLSKLGARAIPAAVYRRALREMTGFIREVWGRRWHGGS